MICRDFRRMDLEVTIGGNDPVELHLWGSRMKRSGKRMRRTEYHIFAHFRLGHRFHVISYEIGNNSALLGSLYDPSTKAYAITSANVSSNLISISNSE